MALIISFPGVSSPPQPETFAGRVLALNPEQARRFQCGGYWLGPARPYARVPEEAQPAPIRAALDDGRLLDITYQLANYKKGHSLIVRGSEIGQAREIEVTHKKIYFIRKGGETCALIPESVEQGAELERQATPGKRLVLPPGFDDSEKYLIRFEPYQEAVL